jgi:hypothetical protein
MAFKMKGSSLYGKLNLNRGGQENRPDGRSKSSAFQKTTDLEKKDDGTYKMPASSKGVKEPDIGEVKDRKERIAENEARKKSHGQFYKDHKDLFTNDDGTVRKDEDGVFRTKDGKSIHDLNQAGRTSAYIRSRDRKGPDGKVVKGYKTEKRDEAHEKSGAPAIWPFKKKLKNSSAELVRVKKKKKADSPELIAFRKKAEERRAADKQAAKDAKKNKKKNRNKKDRNWKVTVGDTSIGNASNPELQKKNPTTEEKRKEALQAANRRMS